jgi:tetratricopeptide (TPR) repeat protein
MKLRPYNTIVLGTIAAVSLAASVLVLKPLDRVRGSSSEEVLYISSPTALKRLSFKYTGLMADIYWTRTIQYYGRLRGAKAQHYDLLYPLLDATATLDPNLVVAYQFGSVFLSLQPPEGAGQPDKAIEFVERGIRANPGEWRLYFNLGFIHYDREDYASAARAFEAGSKIPGSASAMKAMAASCSEKAGSPETARLLWTTLYETTTDQSVRNGALKHLVALQINEDVPALSNIVRTFHDRTGRYPSNFEEMAANGWLRAVPRDPTGDPYKLLPEGRIEIRSPETKPFVKYGLPGGPQGPEPASPQTKQ